jgi:IS1 family transposase
VARKQRSCDPTNPDNDRRGDYWGHVAFDPEHKPVLAVVPGARTEENARAVVAEVEERVGCDPPPLLTSDEYPAYAAAIDEVFGEPMPAPSQRGPGRPRLLPERRSPDDPIYATMHKRRENGRVIAVKQWQVFGTPDALEDVLGESAASRRVKTPFVERQNATDRGRKARKARRTYRFNKDWQVHEALTYPTLYANNFCRCVRTPRVRVEGRRWRER